MKQTQKPLTQDPIFVQIVVSSTGLGLALMLGSLAAVKFTDANRLQFGWNWFIPMWMTVAVIGNQRFWKAVWQAQNDPTPKAKKRLTIHSALLVALAIVRPIDPARGPSANLLLKDEVVPLQSRIDLINCGGGNLTDRRSCVRWAFSCSD